ncbi:MAG: response regulator [Planctomycetota bacterium]
MSISTGQEVLDHLLGAGKYADRTAHPLPDLVLLDLKMPGLDGFELIRRIKALPLLDRLPVVVLASSRVERDRAQSYDCGANGFVEKPGSFDGYVELVHAVSRFWLDFNLPPPLTT